MVAPLLLAESPSPPELVHAVLDLIDEVGFPRELPATLAPHLDGRQLTRARDLPRSSLDGLLRRLALAELSRAMGRWRRRPTGE